MTPCNARRPANPLGSYYSPKQAEVAYYDRLDGWRLFELTFSQRRLTTAPIIIPSSISSC